jgi:uncharacterized membrane protein YgcG
MLNHINKNIRYCKDCHKKESKCRCTAPSFIDESLAIELGIILVEDILSNVSSIDDDDSISIDNSSSGTDYSSSSDSSSYDSGSSGGSDFGSDSGGGFGGGGGSGDW